MLGDSLRKGAAQVGCPRVDIGHVGGDDFLALCHPGQVLSLCKTIVTEFEQAADLLYDPADLRRGFVEIPNRWGSGAARAALVTLSIGVAQSTQEVRRLQSPKLAAAIASEMKKVAKSQPGSYIAIDRRASDVPVRASRAA